MEREKEQDDEAEKKLEWGATARIWQRKVAEARDGKESDGDELERLLED